MFDFQMATQSDKSFIDSTWEKLDKKLSVIALRSRNKIPYTTIDGIHDDRSDDRVTWWTNGFWPGLMWLMYCGTKNEVYKETAETSEEILDKAFEKIDDLDHDTGFRWHISAGVNFRVTGNQKSRMRNLYAANILAARYNPSGNFIRAWNWEPCVAIIDCMMNIPLLYWASEELNDPRFRQIAMNHADTTMKNHIRADGSVKHIVQYDAQTGEFVKNIGGQGYNENSSWSRGQAWGLYGFVLSYIHTRKQEYLDTAKRIAHYFISCICDDGYIPRADFRSPEEPLLYDSTAGACAACGLLELSRNVAPLEGKMYYSAALKILRALDEKYCNYELNEDSIVQMGTERWTDDPERMQKVTHLPIIYGDYYFVEAIYKLKGFGMLFE